MGAGNGLAERFKALIGATRREAVEARVEPPQPPPDPELALVQSLGSWLDDERSRIFVKWLEDQMDKAVGDAHRLHANPTEATYGLGFEGGLRFVRDRLRKWATSR